MAKREERVRIIRVEGGRRREIEISSDQARKLGIRRDRPHHFSTAYLFDGLFAWHRSGVRTNVACSRCGTTQRELVLYRTAGCARCYEEFSETVAGILRLDRSDTMHRGSVPRRLDRYRRLFLERESVRYNLTRAVEQEDFETAARLRDRLHVMDRDDENA